METERITAHMPVIGSDGQRIGTVDRIEGDAIELSGQEMPDGQHHRVPLAWVSGVDQHVHLGKTRDDALRDLLAGAPTGATGQPGGSAGGEPIS
jgi:hypothetical protein